MHPSLVRPRVTLWSTVVAVALQLAACATAIDGRVEQAIVDALPRVLGPAAHYDVAVKGATRQAGGFVDIERVRAVGERVRPPQSPVLDRVEADLVGVRVNRGNRTLSAVDSANLRIRVLASDVTAFLVERSKLADVKVAFHAPHGVTVVGRPVVAGWTSPLPVFLMLSSRLVTMNTQLRLNVTDAHVLGISFGEGLPRLAERLLNPPFDLSTLPISGGVVSAHVVGDALTIVARGGRLGGEVRTNETPTAAAER